MSNPAVPQHPPSAITAFNVPVVVTSVGPSQSSSISSSTGFIVPVDSGKSVIDAAAANDDSRSPRIPADAEDKRGGGRWTSEEDAALRAGIDRIGAKNWKKIALGWLSGKRSDVQCVHRWQKVLRPGLVKGNWTPEEDKIIVESMANCAGSDKEKEKWSIIADKIPGRIGKQCRERWANHLDPALNAGDWSEAEDKELLAAQAELGNAWTKISLRIPGRSENAIKNRWNSAPVRRKVTEMNGGQLPPGASAPPKKRVRKTEPTTSLSGGPPPLGAEGGGVDVSDDSHLPPNKRYRGKKAVELEAPGYGVEAANEPRPPFVSAQATTPPMAVPVIAAMPEKTPLDAQSSRESVQI